MKIKRQLESMNISYTLEYIVKVTFMFIHRKSC